MRDSGRWFAGHVCLLSTTCSPQEGWGGEGTRADAILVSCLSNSFWLLERGAALLSSSQLGLLSKDDMPCHDKHCLNEQGHVQSIVPLLFFAVIEAGLCAHASRGGTAAAASKASHHQQAGANARDKAINSEEGHSHFLRLLDHMCCINANPIML